MKKFLLKNKNILVLLFLSALVTFYLMLPIITHRTNGIFFSLDPDAHYIGNVISYIKSHQINYINHPATPTIMAYVYALTPIRIYTKFIAHINFIDWFILHSEIVYLYLRVFQSILFGMGLFIFSLAVYRITKSLIVSSASIFALFIFGFFTDIALHIRSEATSFFIIAIWLLVFVNFIKSRKLSENFFLAAISGIAVANKFTNIFYFIATIGLIPTIKGVSRRKKVLILLVDILIGFLSFLFFTWPIKQKYPQILQYIIDLFPQSAMSATHSSLFDLSIYIESISSLLIKEFWASIVIIATFILAVYLLFKRKTKISDPICIFAFIILIGILIFARYPLNYYQLAHFVGIIFVLHILLKKSSLYLRLFFLPVAFIAFENIINYYPSLSNAINYSASLDQYAAANPSRIGTIWERGDAKDFALLWGNSWSGAGYSEELVRLRPDLLFEIYFWENYFGQKQNLFNICWDKFYMQKNYLKTFIEKYKNHDFKYNPIPGTNNMYVVERDKC